MRFIIPIGVLGIILFFVFGQDTEKAKIELSEGDLKVTKLDLQKVLDVTVPVIVQNAEESSKITPKTDEEKEKFSSMYFMKTAMDLAKVYNSTNPRIYEDNLDVYPSTVGALVAYEDINKINGRIRDFSFHKNYINNIKKNIDEYFEFPPLIKIKMKAKKPLLKKINIRLNKFLNELNFYNYITFIKLK